MTKKEHIRQTADYIKKVYTGESSGHDWWHIYRVWQAAKHIAALEKADVFIVEMAALLHEVGDYKLDPTGRDRQEELVNKYLKSIKVSSELSQKILDVVANISFSKNVARRRTLSLEGQAVQDADLLDAIGAIGIARAFAYGGAKSRTIHDPASKPKIYRSPEDYKQSRPTSINHFYEKLLHVQGRLNTKTGQRIAKQRHKFMENYLAEFFAEWKGIK